MFISKKKLEQIESELVVLNKYIDALHKRINLAEQVILKMMEDTVVTKRQIQSVELQAIGNSKVLDILIEGDSDRLKALNLIMELVEEANSNTYTLVEILREKGLIDTEDFKGD